MVPIEPITRTRGKKLKETLNELVQNIWSKMDLEELGTSKKHEGQPLIHLIQVRLHTSLVRLVFPNDIRIKSEQFIFLNNQGSFGRSDS